MNDSSAITDSGSLESSRRTLATTPAVHPIGRQGAAAAAALVLLASGSLGLAHGHGWRQGALFLVGGFLGLSLYHALFGFTSAWRAFIVERRGAGLRAQMIMLALAAVVFFPALGSGSLLGRAVHGEVGAVGVSVAVGAFLFGIGMQLGGGCASGTLYTVGGGSTRMLVTLAAFVAGSTAGALHLPWWSARPNLGPIALIEKLGWPAALALHLLLFAAIAVASLAIERRRHGTSEGRLGETGWRRLTRGPWPLAWGAVGLALGNVATLYLAGRPWGVTSAFALWGSKIVAATGVDVASWAYWTSPARRAALANGVLADVTSVMDFGILLGALLAAGLAGKFSPTLRVPARSLAAAVVGGLLLGYGARLAYGCNIGAYFSGIASSSLHGWEWMVAAFAGNVLGTRLRPLFGMA